MDERNRQIAYRVIAVMYFLTIISMQGIVLFRQFSLGQELNDFEDIAVIMTINSLFLVSALLYFGAIPIRKLSIRKILWLFILFVVLGTAFTFAKYNLFGDQGLSLAQFRGKMVIIVSIIGIIMGFWILLSYLGKKRIEKDLEE